MADGMLQDFEGDKIAMSYQGKVALLRRYENWILSYGKEATDIPEQPWVARKLNKDLFKPHDLCFAPNNHLIVWQNGRISLSPEIFTLGSRIQLKLETVRVPHNIMVGWVPFPSYLSHVTFS